MRPNPYWRSSNALVFLRIGRGIPSFIVVDSLIAVGICSIRSFTLTGVCELFAVTNSVLRIKLILECFERKSRDEGFFVGKEGITARVQHFEFALVDPEASYCRLSNL